MDADRDGAGAGCSYEDHRSSPPLTPLLFGAGWLSAHRFYPEPLEAIHAIIGNAGQGLSSFPPANETAKWSVYQGKEWGFSHLRVDNATHLRLDFYGDVPMDAKAPIHHSVTVVRGYPRV